MEEVQEMSRKRDSLQMVIIDRLFAFEPGVSKKSGSSLFGGSIVRISGCCAKRKIMEKFDPSLTDSYYLNGMREAWSGNSFTTGKSLSRFSSV